MADLRLDSGHFDCRLRRDHYRMVREDLLSVRGWLTLAAEGIHGLLCKVDDWPSLLPVRPEQIVPSPKCFLVDPLANCCYPLRIGLNTIGRLPDNDIEFEEITVSRRHCVLIVHVWGGCELYDTASRNGTFVNGRPLCPAIQLNVGDQIRVSRRLLTFVSSEGAEGPEKVTEI
jgi:hypothetical protein